MRKRTKSVKRNCSISNKCKDAFYSSTKLNLTSKNLCVRNNQFNKLVYDTENSQETNNNSDVKNTQSKEFIYSVLHPSAIKEIELTPRTEIKTKIRSRPPTAFCRYKEFNNMPTYNIENPCIRNASPYMSREDVYNEDYKNSKQKWLTKNGFMRHASRHCRGYKIIDNYVEKDPSDPPILHKFRAINKLKWIAGSFK